MPRVVLERDIPVCRRPHRRNRGAARPRPHEMGGNRACSGGMEAGAISRQRRDAQGPRHSRLLDVPRRARLCAPPQEAAARPCGDVPVLQAPCRDVRRPHGDVGVLERGGHRLYQRGSMGVRRRVQGRLARLPRRRLQGRRRAGRALPVRPRRVREHALPQRLRRIRGRDEFPRIQPAVCLRQGARGASQLHDRLWNRRSRHSRHGMRDEPGGGLRRRRRHARLQAPLAFAGGRPGGVHRQVADTHAHGGRCKKLFLRVWRL